MGQFPITTVLLFAIIGSSLYAWNNRDYYSKMVFHPVTVKTRKEWYRFLSSGFVHADYMHIAFNGLALYSFGRMVEYIYIQLFGAQGGMLLYVLAFLVGTAVSSIPAYLKNKENDFYYSLGASGGVSTVVFITIVFNPFGEISLFFLPGIPAIVFGVLYMAYSYVMSKKNVDNIGHDAHLWGALFGLLFVLLTYPVAYISMLEQILDKLS